MRVNALYVILPRFFVVEIRIMLPFIYSPVPLSVRLAYMHGFTIIRVHVSLIDFEM